MSDLWPGGVSFVIELGLGSPSFESLWDAGLWDEAVWAGGAPTYQDVTDYAISASGEDGRARFDERMVTSTARVVFDNAGGRFNPAFGDDTLPGNLTLRVGRWCRIRSYVPISNLIVDLQDGMSFTSSRLGTEIEYLAFGETGTYWLVRLYEQYRTLFEGLVDNLVETYREGASDSEMVVECVGFGALAARDNPPALTSAVGSGELTSARVDRILDGMEWPWRDVAGGLHGMQSTTLAQNRLRELHAAAQAEGGAVWFAGRYATFRPFTWLDPELGADRAVAIQADLGAGVGILTDAIPRWSAQLIRNDVQLARVGGSLIRRQDFTSQSLYGGKYTWSLRDYENDDDDELAAIADRMLEAYAFDYQRLERVTATLDAGASLYEAYSLLRLELGDLVRATVPLTLRGWGYTTEAHIAGVEWALTADDFALTFRLDESLRRNPEALRAHAAGFDDGYH